MIEPETAFATCLGCGCLCDDVGVAINSGSIVGLVNVCPLGRRWFSDGSRPESILIDGAPASLEGALDAAASLLFAQPQRLLIYVAGDLSSETHRAACALADRLGATIDGPTSDTVADGFLAAQRRGRASATLGELRHRADVVLFWGVDPDRRYPRFLERFVAPAPALAASRALVGVDVGPHRAPACCSQRAAIEPAEEVDALRVMQAVASGRPIDNHHPRFETVVALATRLASARYAGIVFDAEPDDPPRDPALAEALIALAQALNGPSRAALFALRRGGNVNGLESVLTWQTGYPFAVEFSRGAPSYVADETTSARLARDRYSAVLLLGDPATVPRSGSELLARVPAVVVGPGASMSSFPAHVAIDTGAASLHTAGLVLRMDDVPIHVRPILTHPRSATDLLRSLAVRAAGEVA